jgi:hypothetical protein
MVFKILHLADVHLDTSFRDSSLGSAASTARREGLRQALEQAFSSARERHVDAITIGGDLYEAERVSPDTAQFLKQLFQQVSPIRIFISPGNHDPYTRNSLYSWFDWPSNVHIFREPRLMPVQLTDGLQLWGAAHDSPAFYQPLFTNFHITDDQTSLLLLHGTDRSLTLGQGKNAFCPFTFEEIQSSGFEMALLGHIHHQHLTPRTNPILCYPGTPEPLGFDEEVGHSILLAEWDGGKWHVEDLDISRWICCSTQLDITDLDSRNQIIEQIRNLWSSERQTKKCLARVIFTGQLSLSLDLNQEAIASSLRTEFEDLVLEDETLPPFDLEALKAESTTTGVFVRRVLQAIETAKQTHGDETQKRLEIALRFGLLALEGREIPKP